MAAFYSSSSNLCPGRHQCLSSRSPSLLQPVLLNSRPCPILLQPPIAAAAFSASNDSSQQAAQQVDYKPFSRRNQSNPHKLLGVGEDADIQEVVDARNYLVDLYRWHEPSREAIEAAYERILSQSYHNRHKLGFRPPRTGRRGEVIAFPRMSSPFAKLRDMFDTSVSLTRLINEGTAYAALALWAIFSLDQSFPLAASFAYSVYKFQTRRTKENPEGPYFGGNPIVGALLTTLASLAVGCGLMALLSVPLASVVDAAKISQVNACVTILFMGLAAVYIK